MESTSPGFAVELGAAALGADDFDDEAKGCVAGVSPRADIGAHWCFFSWMLPLPPLQIVQVAAERDGCALHGGNGDPIGDGCSTLVADACLDELWRNESVPGNAPVPLLINAGRIDQIGRASCRERV